MWRKSIAFLLSKSGIIKHYCGLQSPTLETKWKHFARVHSFYLWHHHHQQFLLLFSALYRRWGEKNIKSCRFILSISDRNWLSFLSSHLASSPFISRPRDWDEKRKNQRNVSIKTTWDMWKHLLSYALELRLWLSNKDVIFIFIAPRWQRRSFSLLKSIFSGWVEAQIFFVQHEQMRRKEKPDSGLVLL